MASERHHERHHERLDGFDDGTLLILATCSVWAGGDLALASLWRWELAASERLFPLRLARYEPLLFRDAIKIVRGQAPPRARVL